MAKQYSYNCQDCGVDCVAKSPKAKRCSACAKATIKAAGFAASRAAAEAKIRAVVAIQEAEAGEVLARNSERIASKSDAWRDRTACLGADTEKFMNGEDAGRPTFTQFVYAETLCRACPVVKECGEEADNELDLYSYRAGVTPFERRERLGLSL